MNACHVLRAVFPARNSSSSAEGAPGSGCVRIRAVLWFVTALLLSTAAWALDVPPPPVQWFTDQAGLLDSSQADALNGKLRAFEESSGAQLIIYAFPSLGGEALEDFTIRCAEKWKVGNKKYDNGLIVFVFKQEKKIRLEVGYGLEPTVTDSFSSDVIRNEIAPGFKEGDYARGLNAGADALMARITNKNAPVPAVQQQGRQAAGRGVSRVDPFFLFVIVMVFMFVILPMLRRGGRGGGGCGGCFWPLLFMNSGGGTFGGGGFSGGGNWGGGGGGGFSGGGGGFGGGGASGGW